eukprot:2861503-Prymnesium_polylepis.1
MALGWDFGRKRWWAGPFLTGILGFGDGSAPPRGVEKFLLRFGITSSSEDLYYHDHLHDGSKERAPKGVHVADLAQMPVELLIQGFRGRRDDPFPQRFHTLEEKKIARKKLARALNLVQELNISNELAESAAKAQQKVRNLGARLKNRRK